MSFTDEFEIIDSHCHVFPMKIAKKAAFSIGGFYGEQPTCDGTVEGLLKEGGSAGTDRFVVQSVATTKKQVQSINRFISEQVSVHSDKLIGFGTLHPGSDSLQDDFAQMEELGLHGIKLHPDIQQFQMDDPMCDPIYDFCQQMHLPILCHTGDRRYDNSNPNRLIPVLKRFPDLTVIGAHLGGWSIWEEASEQLTGFENLLVDCSSSLSYLPKEKARKIIRSYGADRVLYGTDYPLHSPKTEIRLFAELELEEWECRAILCENVRRLLKLDSL